MTEYFDDWDFKKYGDRMPYPRGDYDSEFRYYDFDGLRVLEGDMQYVCDLLEIIMSDEMIEENPYFARKELSNIMNEIQKIKDSEYCLYAKNKDKILRQLKPLEYAVKNLSNKAYDKLEWDI